MQAQAVCSNVDLVDRALAEFERQSNVLSKRRDAVVDKLKEIGQRSARLSKVRARLMRGVRQPSVVQDYLKSQQASRARRAERAKAFIDASTSPQAVSEQLQVGSKIDQALAARKSLAMRRPTY